MLNFDMDKTMLQEQGGTIQTKSARVQNPTDFNNYIVASALLGEAHNNVQLNQNGMPRASTYKKGVLFCQ